MAPQALDKSARMQELQDLMAEFRSVAVHGIRVELVDPQSQLMSQSIFRADSGMGAVSLQPAFAKESKWDLRDVGTVMKGSEFARRVPNLAHLSSNCVGIELDSEEAIRCLHFPEQSRRDAFHACLNIWRMSASNVTSQSQDRADGVADDPAKDTTEEDEKLRKFQCKARRKGVVSESVDNDKIKNYKKPVFAKDEETVRRLDATLKGNQNMQVLFGHLDSQGLRDVINAFQPKEIARGVDIIRQGDPGDCLYMIDEGSVDVFVARPGPMGEIRPGDKGPKATTLGSGALFGELALLYNTPRAATVTAASQMVSTWLLDAVDFKMLLRQSSQETYAKYEGWLSRVELLKSLNHYELSKLADAMSSEQFQAGATIIKQGDHGDRFFFLESGSTAAFIRGGQGEKEVKRYSGTGDYFGEIALLNSEPRKATVRAAEGGCTVASLTATQFTNLMGPLNDILREQAEKYPQYRDFIR